MTIAVTAASGQLGAEIIRATASTMGSANVIGIARTPEKASDLGVEIRRGDYADKSQFESALQDVEPLLLVSGMDAPDERIPQHRNVIGAAVSCGVRKIVYTSVQGSAQGSEQGLGTTTAFSPIVASNRQTEADIRNSGLDWVIGRNGIYIEPDIEYLPTYRATGEIANCAGDGRCGYTTRRELAHAYARMIAGDEHSHQTYNLHGEPITQQQLAAFLSDTFNTTLAYRPMSVEEFQKERVAELGPFIGTVVAGIYEGIRNGHFDNPSDFQAAAGRLHQSWDEYFESLRTRT